MGGLGFCPTNSFCLSFLQGCFRSVALGGAAGLNFVISGTTLKHIAATAKALPSAE